MKKDWKNILNGCMVIFICVFAGTINIQAVLQEQNWAWRILWIGGSISAILGIVFAVKLIWRWGLKKG